ncbi:MAG: 50S ribosome-binding GTPase [Acetobacteraceae bacterium]|nr:50S ribosome-binding GTPase [Acetobacteraceae bacterium]
MPRPRYPSYMARAVRAIEENLSRADVVIEVADARAPRSSRHPNGDRLFASHPRILVLNRADLADPALTRRWLCALGRPGAGPAFKALSASAARGWGVAELSVQVRALAPGRAAGAVRAMVVGLPNLGKSALINRLAGRRKAPTGALPGVTRGEAWVAAGEGLYVLDLPGILYPRPRDASSYLCLAALGVLDPAEYQPEHAACWLLQRLGARVVLALSRRLGVPLPSAGATGPGRPGGSPPAAAGDPHAFLDALARARGYLLTGGRPDVARAARALLKDFGRGLLGRFTLEEPGRAAGRERVSGVEDSPGGGSPWEPGA